jgi:hypothetical protein
MVETDGDSLAVTDFDDEPEEDEEEEDEEAGA